MNHSDNQADAIARKIIEYSKDLGQLSDLDAILDRVLFYSRDISGAEAGSLFLVKDNALLFSYVHNDVLYPEGAANPEIYNSFSIPIDEHSIVGYAAETGRTLAIDDAYNLPDDVPFSFNRKYDKTLGYKSVSMLTIPLESAQNKLVGTIQIINARGADGSIVPFNEEMQVFLSMLAGIATSAIERGLMTRELVLRMMKMAELRDPKETGAHVMRVGTYASELFKQWARNRIKNNKPILPEWNGLQPGEIISKIRQRADLLRLAAMLHDVGKVGVSDTILKKPAKLTDNEFDRMKEHTVYGARLFQNATSDLDRMCGEIALYHHEKWAGGGYPGLHMEQLDGAVDSETIQGERIPIEARITALADVYDALCSKRCYKEPWPEKRVLREIESQSGLHFDPEVATAFNEIYDVIVAIRDKFAGDELFVEEF